ncbi:hypothetical protein PMSD_08795 [Paenibacillus macquariensis subsp. defensor]|uniref:Conserved hypothetical integral membrane protein n=1 Tax=Paenibacillus macquariensis TaxID=948756 RepID=A0ABY1K716_9BACL|nr:DUF1146 family protein [Paenibacillus macquariensis]MEC0092550.1 DUF1146 family protein [Paenibacillus macquariensis]OAB35503.1 hypothetical protein PMSM_09625 [Paenibacillus macquariensis subsp. macquariensis]OAB37646.1 hypothetical protein PMSD_08795 [Paenibacillus macquariensis subsp. defensor]SIR34700.1 conserved hypothetical integral membrane protein [Paenibacillus macquariensis]
MNEGLANTVSSAVSVSGLVSIVVSLFCIWLSWWALQNLKLDLVIRNPQGTQGKLLQVLLAIVLGHFVAGFLLDYLTWSQMIRYMF